LDRDTVLFVGFSRDAGPATFCARSGRGAYERVAVSESLTMYRVLIPVRSTGAKEPGA